jgi:serine protease Do
MFSKLSLSILIVTSSFVLSIGQTPEAKKEDAEKAARTFAFAFDGDGGYLGVQTEEVTKDNFAKFGLREVRGVAVEKVVDESPAAAAGLRAGDVIVRLNSEEITSTRKLSRLISEIAPDHQVKLTIMRNGRDQDITATVAKRPAPKFGNGNFAFTMPEGMNKLELEKLQSLPMLKDLPEGGANVFTVPRGGDDNSFVWRAGSGRQIGIGVYPVTKQLGERFGVDSGVMINNVREDSPAAKAGLKAGDIIVEIDGKAVKGSVDLIRAINEKKEGDVTLIIVRDRNRQTLTVTPETSKDGGFVFQTDDMDAPIAPPRMGAMGAPRPPMSTVPMTAPMPRALPAPQALIAPGRVI